MLHANLTVVASASGRWGYFLGSLVTRESEYEDGHSAQDSLVMPFLLDAGNANWPGRMVTFTRAVSPSFRMPACTAAIARSESDVYGPLPQTRPPLVRPVTRKTYDLPAKRTTVGSLLGSPI